MLERVKALLQLGYFSNPWATGRLEQAREDFRAGRITEWQFRLLLGRLGYTRYGIDSEVSDQLGILAAPQL